MGPSVFFALSLSRRERAAKEERWSMKKNNSCKKRKRSAQKKKREFALFLPLPHKTANPIPGPKATRHGKSEGLK
jgi:hypothetical protein